MGEATYHHSARLEAKHKEVIVTAHRQDANVPSIFNIEVGWVRVRVQGHVDEKGYECSTVHDILVSIYAAAIAYLIVESMAPAGLKMETHRALLDH